jgi:hypothetical protein
MIYYGAVKDEEGKKTLAEARSNQHYDCFTCGICCLLLLLLLVCGGGGELLLLVSVLDKAGFISCMVTLCRGTGTCIAPVCQCCLPFFEFYA